MAYDLEEQEQLASLKAWWKDYGTHVVVGVCTAAILAGGWVGWRNWQLSQARGAGAQYDALLRAGESNDQKALREAGAALTENYGRTVYAAMGALATAKFHFERGDLRGARAQLQWVLERGATDELKELARLRMAAVLLDERSHDEALKLLETKPAAPLQAQYEALKGDILVAKKQPADAKVAYRAALDKPGVSESFKASVQMRLDAVGG